MSKGKAKEKELVLTSEELAILDKSYSDHQLKEKDIEIAKLRSDKSKVELTLISANYTLKSKECSELEKELSGKKLELEKTKNNHKVILDKIRDRLDLPDKFGFDPITGEVKI